MAIEEVQSSLNRSTKYGNSPSSALYMDIDTQFHKDICCGNFRCRRGKSNGVLEHRFIRHLIDLTEFLRKEVKAKSKIIDHLLTLKTIVA